MSNYPGGARVARSELSDKTMRTNNRCSNRLGVECRELDRAQKVIEKELCQEKKNLQQSFLEARRRSCPTLSTFKTMAKVALQERLESEKLAQEARLRNFLSGEAPSNAENLSEEDKPTEDDEEKTKTYRQKGFRKSFSEPNGMEHLEQQRVFSCEMMKSKSKVRSGEGGSGGGDDFWSRMSKPKEASGMKSTSSRHPEGVGGKDLKRGYIGGKRGQGSRKMSATPALGTIQHDQVINVTSKTKGMSTS